MIADSLEVFHYSVITADPLITWRARVVFNLVIISGKSYLVSGLKVRGTRYSKCKHVFNLVHLVSLGTWSQESRCDSSLILSSSSTQPIIILLPPLD